MATKKKTTVQELKELIDATPKANILTEEQLKTLRDLATDIMRIRRTLEDLEGEDNVSRIMFHVGSIYNVANTAETIIDELVDSYEEECDECGDDF
jgi:prefoldin subunit 5